jgi:hypothetical protein
MNEFKEKTGVQFIHINDCSRTYGNDPAVCGGCKVKFSIRNDQRGCFANVGYSKHQPLELNVEPNGCDWYRTYLHELGHVLGLMHEHVHPDRKVIILRKGLDFNSDNYAEVDDFALSPYDPTSVMHYNEDSICWPKDTSIKYCDVNQSKRDGCVVPTEKDCDRSLQKSFGKSEHLSAGDIQNIQTLYGIDTTAGEGTDLSVVTQAPRKIPKAPRKITKAPRKITKAPRKITQAPPKVTEAPPKITQPRSTKPMCVHHLRG